MGACSAKSHPTSRPAAAAVAVVEPQKRPGAQDARWWHELGTRGGGVVAAHRFSSCDCFVRALELSPSHAKAWHGLGMCGGGAVSGEYFSKAACFARAVELSPKFSQAWSELSLCRGGIVNGVFIASKDCSCRAVKLDPTCAKAWYAAGVNGGGKQCFVEAVVNDPKLAEAWCELGCFQGVTDLKGVRISRKDCNIRALQLDRFCAKAWVNLSLSGGGVVGGKFRSSEECLSCAGSLKSLPLGPTLLEWHYGAQSTLAQTPAMQDAKTEWRGAALPPPTQTSVAIEDTQADRQPPFPSLPTLKPVVPEGDQQPSAAAEEDEPEGAIWF